METWMIGILGAGTMGTGIAQLAASHGHPVRVYDNDGRALQKSQQRLEEILARLTGKGRLDANTARAIRDRVEFSSSLSSLAGSRLVIEAIVEDLATKRAAFRRVEKEISEDAWLATNTSSLSVTGIAAACRHPARVLGLHFFNPAPVMALVEVVPGLLTDSALVDRALALMESWGKTPVRARDTPGFIVNRVARPFYGEALRLLEEGVAAVPTIDWAMRELGGFPMGPFQLMDLIGNDVNLTVTRQVFEAFFYDPRFRPSQVQIQLVAAGMLGKKSGRGFYDYRQPDANPEPDRDTELGGQILDRIVAMLINEAADAVFLQVATPDHVDRAMTAGVGYPRGLLAWADELGLDVVLARLERLHQEYGEDRYRPNPLLRRMARAGSNFFPVSG